MKRLTRYLTMFPPCVQVVSENSVLQCSWHQAVTPDDTSPFVDPTGHPHRDRPPTCEPPARPRPVVCMVCIPALHGNGAQRHFRWTEVLLAAERLLQAGGTECKASGSVLRPTLPSPTLSWVAVSWASLVSWSATDGCEW